ncbi:MAG: snoK, partial [Myxococcota bacterium]
MGEATDIHRAWEGDNQDWWDWYVSLAENPTPIGELRPPSEPLAHPGPLNQAALEQELSEPYELSDDAIRRFQHDGYVRLPGVVSESAALLLRAKLVQLLEQRFSTSLDG